MDLVCGSSNLDFAPDNGDPEVVAVVFCRFVGASTW